MGALPFRRIARLWLLLGVVISSRCGAFLPVASPPHRRHAAGVAPRMVRNIDYPEVIVLYGPELSLQMDGLDAFLGDCAEMGTPVVALGYAADEDDDDDAGLPALRRTHPALVLHERPTRRAPPDPRDLWDALQALEVRPRPFGGSAGFGAPRAADPPRPPLPARAVVLAAAPAATRAARAVGARVLRVGSGNDADDPLADAAVPDLEGLWLEDVATPGSFWLNPPQPRDDDGIRVNPKEVMRWYQAAEECGAAATTPEAAAAAAAMPVSDDMDEDGLRGVLADLAPL